MHDPAALALEGLVYEQLGALRGSLFSWAAQFNIEPRLLAAILITERQQYHLPEALRAIHRAGHGLLDLIGMASKKARPWVDTTNGWGGLCAWLQCSRGFCRIKWETAQTAWERSKTHQDGPKLTERELCHHTMEPDLSVAVSCLILDELARQWEPVVKDIRKAPHLMATLYNISDFTNKLPHGNPQVGGSILRSVVDGEFLPPEFFGLRALRIYHSSKMEKWICQ